MACISEWCVCMSAFLPACLPTCFYGSSSCSVVLCKVKLFTHVYCIYIKVKYNVRINMQSMHWNAMPCNMQCNWMQCNVCKCVRVYVTPCDLLCCGVIWCALSEEYLSMCNRLNRSNALECAAQWFSSCIYLWNYLYIYIYNIYCRHLSMECDVIQPNSFRYTMYCDD